jgi:hypothetical protein
MEQLSPFEILRFHMPEVLSVLSNLRGRNVWDSATLGPFVKQLQNLNPANAHRKGQNNDAEGGYDDDSFEIYGPCQAAQKLVEQLKSMVPNVCGGVPSRMEPMQQWLDAISDAIDELSREAETVKGFVNSVNIGIKLGHQLLKLIKWRVPPEAEMHNAIIAHVLGKPVNDPDLPRETVNTALQKLASKDERTLKELIGQGLQRTEAARLLLGRAQTLLERELRRKALDDRIHDLSQGGPVEPKELEKGKWYWVENGDGWRAFTFTGKSSDGRRLKFTDVETGVENLFKTREVSLLKYIPVAEAISRAQKAFMVIELDHGKRFSYNSFMEFGSPQSSNSLRTRLRRLVTLSQVQCSALDQARLNVLQEVKNSVNSPKKSAKYATSRIVPECRPQNVTVLGGGPTGLLMAIHCTQNVILSGGQVKLYEGRDAFNQEASAFERAQIVRLDARQIAMLRYHLGTGYEDVYVPAKGETDAHLGNSLPSQGFVEVTIKRLESMLLDELINLRSKNLIQFYSDSKVKYDFDTGAFQKQGKALKIDDQIVLGGGQKAKVQDFVYTSRVMPTSLVVGKDYDIVHPREKKVRSYRLVQMDQAYDHYQFAAHQPGLADITGSFSQLPPVYPNGQGRIDPSGIIVESDGSKQELAFDDVADKDFELDVSNSHVILALGKPNKSPAHFYATTEEPYAVCCVEGLKISMGMHNFGEKRWGSGLADDIRSLTDQNTRVIGDFTKSVNLVPITKRMQKKLTDDTVWKTHFEQLAETLNDKLPSLYTKLLGEVSILTGTSFHRKRLQTRFFELGNNYYLGMELPREYDAWKKSSIEKIAPSKPETAPAAAKKVRQTLQRTLHNHLDRLWYESTLEIIAMGDVYNPGGRSKIPQLYMIDSPFEQKLGELDEQDAFKLAKSMYRVQEHDGNGLTHISFEFEKETFTLSSKTYVLDKSTRSKKTLGELTSGEVFESIDIFELVEKGRRSSVVRTSTGHVFTLKNSTRVSRASDLARAPNGYDESKVALSSFPVAHVVCHRTLQVSRVQGKGGEDGYMAAYVGDAQASVSTELPFLSEFSAGSDHIV